MARRGDEFGFTTGGAVQVNMPRVKARKDDIVRQSSQGVEDWMRKTANITVYDGHGRFTSANTVSVNGEVLQAEQIFINVGARANVPDFSGGKPVPILTNTGILELDDAAGAPAHRRRQLHRARVRADVPPLRQPRDRDREERPPDRARRRGRVGDGPSGAGSRGRRVPPLGDLHRAEHDADRCVGVGGLHARRAVARRQPRAGGRRSPPEHRRPGARGGGHRRRRQGLHHRGRPVPHERARRVGARRMQRPWRVHAHRVQRLRSGGGQRPGRRSAAHQPAHSLLRAVCRSGGGPRRHDHRRRREPRAGGCWSAIVR